MIRTGRGRYEKRRSQRAGVKKEAVAALKTSIKQFVKSLKDKELVIFRERLLADEPLTLREIGERYGISRERVRQIEERVKNKIQVYRLEFNDRKGTRVGARAGMTDRRGDASLTNSLK